MTFALCPQLRLRNFAIGVDNDHFSAVSANNFAVAKPKPRAGGRLPVIISDFYLFNNIFSLHDVRMLINRIYFRYWLIEEENNHELIAAQMQKMVNTELKLRYQVENPQPSGDKPPRLPPLLIIEEAMG